MALFGLILSAMGAFGVLTASEWLRGRCVFGIYDFSKTSFFVVKKEAYLDD